MSSGGESGRVSVNDIHPDEDPEDFMANHMAMMASNPEYAQLFMAQMQVGIIPRYSLL